MESAWPETASELMTNRNTRPSARRMGSSWPRGRLVSNAICGCLTAFQDESRHTEGIDPHRHMTPAVPADPPGMRWEFGAALGAFRDDPVAIAKRHCYWNSAVSP